MWVCLTKTEWCNVIYTERTSHAPHPRPPNPQWGMERPKTNEELKNYRDGQTNIMWRHID
jgi:hypothetical protein